MVVVPKLTPVNNPLLLMVATAVLLLLHVPPGVVLASVCELPKQAPGPPVMAGTIGNAFTVTNILLALIQPFEFVILYVMFAVPAAIPETNPVVVTVATAVLPLAHTPPAVVLANCVVLFTHTLLVPVIGLTAGNEFTVMAAEPNVEIQPLEFVTSTVTTFPLPIVVLV